MDCACDSCQNLCRQKPGWFTPDQIERLAQKLGLPIVDLFRRFLTIDAALVENSGQMRAIYVLAPAMVGKKSGAISDPSARGICVWFKDGQCQIHEMKPRECSLVDHTTSRTQGDLIRASILKSWLPHKSFVQQLYEKKLKAPDALRKLYRKIQGEKESALPRD